MAKKPADASAAKKKSSSAAAPRRAAKTRTSGVRNSPIPKKVSAAAKSAKPAVAAPKPVVTQEMIAMRAYEISQSPYCGGELDNWLRAERELFGA